MIISKLILYLLSIKFSIFSFWKLILKHKTISKNIFINSSFLFWSVMNISSGLFVNSLILFFASSIISVLDTASFFGSNIFNISSA